MGRAGAPASDQAAPREAGPNVRALTHALGRCRG